MPHVSYLLPSIRGLQAAGFQSTRCQIFVLSTYLDPTMSPWIRQVVLLVATYWLACPMRGPTTCCVHSCALIWFMLYCHAVLPSFVTTLAEATCTQECMQHNTLSIFAPPQACTPLVYNELQPFSFGLSHLALAAVLGQERQNAMAGTTCSDAVACEPRPRAPNCHRWHNSCWMFRHGCLAESAIVDTPPRGMVARIARP